MYAVVKTGGKQYRVQEGQTLKVEKLEVADGQSLQLLDVLMIVDGANTVLGAPMIEGAAVEAKVISHGRGKKIKIVKFRRRKHSRKQMGHRQSYTEIEITKIVGSGAKAAKAEKAPKPAAEKKPAATAEPKAAKASSGDMFMAEPNGKADDLKKITGVGPAMEKKLNAAGVFHFSQIAAFSPEDVAKLDEMVAAKGKIEKDNWIEESKGFAG